MPFDQKTRNLLQRTVAACRDRLAGKWDNPAAGEFPRQLQQVYGINPDGTAAPLEKLGHLADEDMQVARLLRDRLDHLAAGLVAQGKKEAEARKEAVGRLTREQAFTVLNRLAALRMAEERGIVLECVRHGLQSEGFQLFEQSAGSAFGGNFETYRAYLFLLFDELAADLGILFSRWDPAGLLFPRQEALEAILRELNGSGEAAKRESIDPGQFNALWAEDEAIGWIYQYYNDESERKKMREESAAPRNSRELAVRNQFFTPRYVVEFLTDNTLGRIWYEMTKGRTRLKDQCRYLVRRPTEVFLAEGEGEHLPVPFDQPLDTIIGDPREAHSKIFLEENPDDYLPPSGWHAEAFQGNFANLPEDGGDPWTRWVGAAIPPEQIDRIIGEKWEPMENDRRIDALRRSILSGNPDPETRKLPVIWAILSDFARTSQFDGGYGASNWELLWTYFRQIAQDWQKYGSPNATTLSQEELLKQPVHIPHRPLKDPREIRLLDPACGSMHFGLYAFDIFETIYDEHWDGFRVNASLAPIGGEGRGEGAGVSLKPLTELYSDKQSYLRDVPRLIIEHNLQGIDIDPRCAQIAGLSLWLRAQKAWQAMGLTPAERPVVKRSNIVCAEPMPGEKELLREFVEQQFPAGERSVFLHLLETVFDKMQLAGEAGSLLKIEEEIKSAIEEAKQAWEKLLAKPRELFSTDELNKVSRQPELTDLGQAVQSAIAAGFWEHIEERIYAALRDYAEQAEDGAGFQRRLFAEDAARGFAFIDLCRKRYDAVVMNPPFGKYTKDWAKEAKLSYPNSANDILAGFVQRGLELLVGRGFNGAITSRTCFFLASFSDWRARIVLSQSGIRAITDLGQGVMDDAMVEAAAYVLESAAPSKEFIVFRAIAGADRQTILKAGLQAYQQGRNHSTIFVAKQETFRLLPDSPFVYWVDDIAIRQFSRDELFEPHVGNVRVGLRTGNDFRFVRALWEVAFSHLTTRGEPPFGWVPHVKAGPSQPFYSPITLVAQWSAGGRENRVFLKDKWNVGPQAVDFYFRPGMSWTSRAVRFIPYFTGVRFNWGTKIATHCK